MYTPYEQGVIAERERCCRALCPLCRAAPPHGSGRLEDGSRVSAVRQHGRAGFCHWIESLQGSQSVPCRAAVLLAVEAGPGW